MVLAALPDSYSPRRRWFSPVFDALSFFVSHLFLYPVPLVAYAVYLIFWGNGFSRTVALLSLVAYTLSMFDGAQYTGNRTWVAFRWMWMGCHSYFPVVSVRREWIPLETGRSMFRTSGRVLSRSQKCTTVVAIPRLQTRATPEFSISELGHLFLDSTHMVHCQ